jgi:hypothetical protein
MYKTFPAPPNNAFAVDFSTTSCVLLSAISASFLTTEVVALSPGYFKASISFYDPRNTCYKTNIALRDADKASFNTNRASLDVGNASCNTTEAYHDRRKAHGDT